MRWPAALHSMRRRAAAAVCCTHAAMTYAQLQFNLGSMRYRVSLRVLGKIIGADHFRHIVLSLMQGALFAMLLLWLHRNIRHLQSVWCWVFVVAAAAVLGVWCCRELSGMFNCSCRQLTAW
jgi:hypothetical protein